MRIAIVFVGALDDRGFNASALEGARRMQAEAAARIDIVDGVPYDPSAMTEALHRAAERCDGVVIIGGQGNAVMPPVATAFPDRAFAVVQGHVTGPNLASYDVLQEQSAFLAGVLAARLTHSGVVGHLSGHRVAPGLKGRAAFAAGVARGDARVRFVTGFCGTQDDSAITERWAGAIAAEGADILFTMLNAARDGATRACRAAGIRQIGNVTDWSATEPDVFVASALARIDKGVARAVEDMCAGHRPDRVVPLGFPEEAIGLGYAPDVPVALRREIAEIAAAVSLGTERVETDYNGPEMDMSA